LNVRFKQLRQPLVFPITCQSRSRVLKLPLAGSFAPKLGWLLTLKFPLESKTNSYLYYHFNMISMRKNLTDSSDSYYQLPSLF
jgi:hypothetical protein